MSVTIRCVDVGKTTDGEFDASCAVMRSVGWGAGLAEVPPKQIQMRASTVFLHAVVGGSVVGTCQYEPHSQRLRRLAVDPGYQGQGIGTKLVEHVFLLARDHGHICVYVKPVFTALEWYIRRGGFEFCPRTTARSECVVLKKEWRA